MRKHRLGRPETDAELGQRLKDQRDHVRQTYGRRRMWIWLEQQGIADLRAYCLNTGGFSNFPRKKFSERMNA